MGVLKQADAGIPVPELCREHGMSAVSVYKWCAKYGGMDAPMISRLKRAGARKPTAEENVRRRAPKI